MKKGKILLTLILVIILASALSGSAPPDSLNIDPFGKIFIYKKVDIPQNIAIIISGDAGWKYGVSDFAKIFSEMNTLVVGVDILQYYKALHQSKEDCLMVASDFVQLTAAVEKKYNFSDYKPPVIMGYSSGATLVYAILAQALSGTFIGGISIGFCSDIGLSNSFCQTNGLILKADPTGKKYFLQPDIKLGNPWIVLQGKLDKICNFREVADFVQRTNNAELIQLPNVGHDFSKQADFMPQWKKAFNQLLTRYQSELATETRTIPFKNIPAVITEAKVADKSAPVALLISGDGGWYGFEQNIANHLSDYGISTIGLDSRKYFWKRKTPEETAKDITNQLIYYGNQWKKNRFILIGYSFGAEVVPFIINRLPVELRSKVVSAVLLSPDTFTDFEIHISNMLGMGNRQNTYNVTGEIIKMQSVPTLCIFGQNEKSPVPAMLAKTTVKIAQLPGDHHYKSNLQLIVKTMKDNKVF